MHMKLSVLLAISLLRRPTLEKYALACREPSLATVCRLGIDMQKVRRMLSFLSDGRHRICFYGMEEYPAQFCHLENPPFCLMYTGHLPEAGTQLLTLCGTRYPDGNAAQDAYAFALEAAANDVQLVVSNSRGIDRSAVYACVDLNRKPLVVCDCGLATSRITADALLDSVSLVSAFEPDAPALAFRCLSRNVLSTAFGEATVVMQAPKRSGSLHCATCALDQGKDVFVHRIGDTALYDGNRMLLEMGAPMIRDYADLAFLLGWKKWVHLGPDPRKESLYRFGCSWYSLEYD